MDGSRVWIIRENVFMEFQLASFQMAFLNPSDWKSQMIEQIKKRIPLKDQQNIFVSNLLQVKN